MFGSGVILGLFLFWTWRVQILGPVCVWGGGAGCSCCRLWQRSWRGRVCGAPLFGWHLSFWSRGPSARPLFGRGSWTSPLVIASAAVVSAVLLLLCFPTFTSATGKMSAGKQFIARRCSNCCLGYLNWDAVRKIHNKITNRYPTQLSPRPLVL